ncbi:uncharacterized protein [Lolium perenne]|uniref:uncharacterized protein n=1 Tax=Lolium perenne TaxID=4522 RepID=UPI003A9A1517
MKPVDECLLKSRFAAGRLRDVVLGMAKERKDHIRLRGWGNLLEVGSFSAPEGLLEWIIDRTNPELGEFRNPRSNASILFTKDMIVKVLGLPSGKRPVVLTGKHQESAHREFFKIDYNHGRRAPIHHAIDMLDKGNLDEETYFRTFFEVALGTYLCPGTGNMLPLEYLGSLDDSNQVKDYDWGAHILQNVMSEVDAFQKKKANNKLQNEPKKIWVGSCLPVLAIIFMDHLEFPESSLSVHHIDYSLPRASHVSDADFKFVMKHDKSRLSLNSHSYGARPFRPFHMTPYANQHAPFGHQPDQPPLVLVPQPPPQTNIILSDATTRQGQTSNMNVTNVTLRQRETNTNHTSNVSLQASKHVITPQAQTNRNHTTEEHPDFMIPIFEKHKQLWAKDMEDIQAMCTEKHGTRMAEFARDVIAAWKVHPAPTTSFASPPRAVDVSNIHEAEGSASKATPETRFWKEAVQIAQEVEKSKEKSSRQKMKPDTPAAATSAQTNPYQGASHTTYYDIEPPSFSLLLPGESWSQPLPPTDQLEQADVLDTFAFQTVPTAPSHGQDHIASREHEHTASLDPATSHKQAPSAAPTIVIKRTPEPVHTEDTETSIVDTIGTQTQEKKNRKKRAFLGLNEANASKKIKTTDDQKESYYKFILKQCVKPPKKGEKRPHFVDFGDYHISYEHFREALRPRGHIDTHVMELFIRHFNNETDNVTSNLHTCTKFAFSQSLTQKLLVDEDKFDPTSCLREFNKLYKEHKLKSKDLLFFAIVDTEHWILCCINLIHKQINILDSMKRVHKTQVYEKADVLVTNFSKLASLAKAFPNTNFMEFVCSNPLECRLQSTLFDCGVFTMLHMQHWEGKILKPFCMKMLENRMLIVHVILHSTLNKADPTWVLKKK